MDYPKEFSAQARARVEAERLKACIKFEEAQRSLKPPRSVVIHGPGSCIHRLPAPEVFDERAFHLYILRVFLAFSREACELGKQGIWTVDRIQSEAKQFLCRFTVAEYHEQFQDRFGLGRVQIWDVERNRPLVADATGAGSLLPKVKRFIYESEEWRHCEAELLAIAGQQAQGAESKGPAEGGFGTRKEPAPNAADDATSVQPTTVDSENGENTAALGVKSDPTKQEDSKPRPGKERKGDASLLAGKRAVNFKIAEQYLGLTERQRQNLVKDQILVVEGKGQSKKITTDSLRAYVTPENPN